MKLTKLMTTYIGFPPEEGYFNFLIGKAIRRQLTIKQKCFTWLPSNLEGTIRPWNIYISTGCQIQTRKPRCPKYTLDIACHSKMYKAKNNAEIVCEKSERVSSSFYK